MENLIHMSPAPAPAKPKVDPGTKPATKPGKKTWNPTKPLVAPRPKAFFTIDSAK